MLIQSLEQTFTVIQLRNSSDESESYLCRDYGQQSPSDYLLVKIKDQDFAQQLIPSFMKMEQERAFLDFAGSFTQEGSLYAAFHYSDFPTLSQKMERETCVLKERLEIMKNLLEKIILYKMPLYFQQHVLHMDRICVSPALEIGFRYELQDMYRYFEVQQEHINRFLWNLLQSLFLKELTQHTCAELELFAGEAEAFSGELEEFYQNFMQLYWKLQGQQKPEKVSQQNGRLFRIWEKIKKIARFLRPILATGVLVAILFYLIFIMGRDKTLVRGAQKFEYIGTVQILE